MLKKDISHKFLQSYKYKQANLKVTLKIIS